MADFPTQKPRYPFLGEDSFTEVDQPLECTSGERNPPRADIRGRGRAEKSKSRQRSLRGFKGKTQRTQPKFRLLGDESAGTLCSRKTDVELARMRRIKTGTEVHGKSARRQVEWFASPAPKNSGHTDRMRSVNVPNILRLLNGKKFPAKTDVDHQTLVNALRRAKPSQQGKLVECLIYNVTHEDLLLEGSGDLKNVRAIIEAALMISGIEPNPGMDHKRNFRNEAKERRKKDRECVRPTFKINDQLKALQKSGTKVSLKEVLCTPYVDSFLPAPYVYYDKGRCCCKECGCAVSLGVGNGMKLYFHMPAFSVINISGIGDVCFIEKHEDVKDLPVKGFLRDLERVKSVVRSAGQDLSAFVTASTKEGKKPSSMEDDTITTLFTLPEDEQPNAPESGSPSVEKSNDEEPPKAGRNDDPHKGQPDPPVQPPPPVAQAAAAQVALRPLDGLRLTGDELSDAVAAHYGPTMSSSQEVVHVVQCTEDRRMLVDQNVPLARYSHVMVEKHFGVFAPTNNQAFNKELFFLLSIWQYLWYAALAYNILTLGFSGAVLTVLSLPLTYLTFGCMYPIKVVLLIYHLLCFIRSPEYIITHFPTMGLLLLSVCLYKRAWLHFGVQNVRLCYIPHLLSQLMLDHPRYVTSVDVLKANMRSKLRRVANFPLEQTTAMECIEGTEIAGLFCASKEGFSVGHRLPNRAGGCMPLVTEQRRLDYLIRYQGVEIWNFLLVHALDSFATAYTRFGVIRANTPVIARVVAASAVGAYAWVAPWWPILRMASRDLCASAGAMICMICAIIATVVAPLRLQCARLLLAFRANNAAPITVAFVLATLLAMVLFRWTALAPLLWSGG